MRRTPFVIAALNLATSSAFAGDCSPLVAGLTEYLKSNSNGLSTIITTNHGPRAFATYTQMPLQDNGLTISGTGYQYFSNRTYYTNATKTWAPFSNQNTDSLQVVIHKSPAKLEFKLNGGEGGVITSVPSCEGNLMFGTLNGGDSAYTLSFYKYRQVP